MILFSSNFLLKKYRNLLFTGKKAYIQVKFSRILQPANSGAVGLGRVITTLYINNTINEPIFTSNNK